MNKQLVMRMKKELELLGCDPPPGIMCWPVDDNLNSLSARIKGPKETPYENGIFQVDVKIPERYPFEPPKAQFVTPIYHPNIDNQGRICLDILKMPPKGSWKPSLNISTMLTSLLVLMSEPNPDDPLLVEVAKEYSENRSMFLKKARKWTLTYASEKAESNPENHSDQSLSAIERTTLQADDSLNGNLTALPASPETSCSNAQDAGKRSLFDLLKKRPRNEPIHTNPPSEDTPTSCIVKKPKTFSLTTKRRLTNDPVISDDTKEHLKATVECTIIASDSSDDEPSTVTDDSISHIQVKPQINDKQSNSKERFPTDNATSSGPAIKLAKLQTTIPSEKKEPKQHKSRLGSSIQKCEPAVANQTKQHTGPLEIIELIDSSDEEQCAKPPENPECRVDVKSNAHTAEIIDKVSTDRSLKPADSLKKDPLVQGRGEATSSYFGATAPKTVSISSPSDKRGVKDKRSLLKLKPRTVKTSNAV
ncbi:hypothetical protein K493DRAFT_341428 [Basidiobolus meristosporus CBS 931.73]|uniref:E2 ubiquitin-conjugating enzyme n=1 Tax=Basidiobolus meristosporus CBS 931.73 TaxID=1314790 RepID=A0A1Y1XQ01_9FUNG|nr:hypothetical protein K493DRAFT_341428 [Basidiobolus meristosporus CBS 931.73]|eukprot:ORX87830.1 hypothetical protein K493DRAFT_341428 [Basidiobolus meristosporus CBS 931.73]